MRVRASLRAGVFSSARLRYTAGMAVSDLPLKDGDSTYRVPPLPSEGRWGSRPAPTNLDKFWSRNPTGLDRIPIPHRDSIPVNGKGYTWADDALNLEMRSREEDYPHPKGLPGRDDPRRCKGWNWNEARPCRAWAARNVENTYIDFCRHHLGGQLENEVTGSSIKRWATGVALTARAIVAGASARTRHGAYSAVLKEKLRLILEGQDLQDDTTREKLERAADDEDEEKADRAQRALARLKVQQKNVDDMRFLSQVMEAVDTDDLVAGLNDAQRMLLGRLALLQVQEAEGRINMAEMIQGQVLLIGELRKTAATKFAIIGSSSDELDRAVDTALAEYGLGGSNGTVLHRPEALNDGRDGEGDHADLIQRTEGLSPDGDEWAADDPT